MLKRSFVCLLPGLLLVALLFPEASGDYYGDGVSAYKGKNYSRAAQLLQASLSESGKPNPDALFYLGLSYTQMKRYEEARKAFEYVIQLVPASHELAAKSRNNISYLTSQQIALASNSGKANQIIKTALSRTSKDNYLTHVIPNGKIVHFSSQKMPLKVYISNGFHVSGWHTGMKQAVSMAMRRWQSASGGKVSFVQTANANQADITVRWQKNFPDNILGVSPFQSVGDTLVRSDITLAVYYPNSNQPIPYNSLVTIATHEMGHAIGLKGHSPYPDDIMYYSTSHSGDQSLSQRDINTIGMLYKLNADVQNSTSGSTAQTQRSYELYQLGVQAQKQNRVTEAMTYYRQALQLNRDLVEAKFNLGALLINEGTRLVRGQQLQAAQKNFEEASRLYTEVSRHRTPPSGTQENLQIAQSNLNIVTQALKP
ncbi:tetratricopeptide repeat protein [Vampirovibrio chlorellavorus]|uniref:tetratricopeptide repeat protein n=1 Tax=Vampirovibrio chlorellavorus TaxID=758823 RepID=UPI0026E9B85A|nr:tetratricopeptide repeat protein [Vampirovibrio chlorellavorus]